MSPDKQLQAFAQSIYLTVKGRYFDDIDTDDGTEYIARTIDWANMFVDELENTTDPNGELVDWWFTRAAGFNLGTAQTDAASITVPTSIDHLITDENRYVQIQQDGTTVSNWAVVHAKDITNSSVRVTEDMCAVVGNSLVFSRAFRDTEAGGIIIGDVSTKLPRLSATNVKLLTTVRPKQLLILGVAKNMTLPDVVQGGLSPSYVQKYQDLLSGAIQRSNASSQSIAAVRQSFSGIGGV
jgi:hypothetical protein